MDVDLEQLVEHAKQARLRAYAPYSKFAVGSALLDNASTIHYGCNVENGSYGATICAERTAIIRAITDGVSPKQFQALAIVADTLGFCPPCGLCRQVMLELCPPQMPVIMSNLQGETKVTTVQALLPDAFVFERNDES
jgi:cytidine deaminase